MPNKSGQYVYMEDGTVAQQVYAANAADVNSVTPVDIQSRLASTIQTHNGAVVPPTTGQSTSSWFDADGFDKIGVTVKNDAATNNAVNIQWSHDNSALFSETVAFTTAASQYRSGEFPVVARYFRVLIANTDAAPHTFNAFAYLKA